MDNAFIGRQPIYDTNLQVVAYELLSRSGNGNAANIVDGDQATTNVIINALTEIGMENLIGPHRAFINLTRNFILSMGEHPMPEIKDRVVLEILEDIEADAEVVTSVQKLASNGYSIALDDFIYRDDLQPLVSLADIIKIDLLALDEKQLRQHVRKLANGSRKLLAEKVETQQQFELCKELGFDYFQGYFFCKPNIVSGKRLPANKLAILQLLANLQDPDSDAEQLSKVIMQDVTMSFRVLRYINSAQFNLGKEVDSIKQTIMLLGRSTIQNLANLVAMSHIDDKPHELFVTAMLRAKMAELLAQANGIKQADSYFTTGLFSVIDAMMDQPMDSLMQTLPLSHEVKQALLQNSGDLGAAIACVKAYEQADWDNSQYNNLDAETIRNAYLEAITWTNSSIELFR